MSNHQKRSWWTRQNFGHKVLWIIVAFVILALLMASPTYWHWAFGG